MSADEGGFVRQRQYLIWLIVLALGFVSSPSAVARAQRPGVSVESNVVYGMYSGLALLMDVYRPARPNGSAIVAIQGSGWYSPPGDPRLPDHIGEAVRWFDRHLKAR